MGARSAAGRAEGERRTRHPRSARPADSPRTRPLRHAHPFTRELRRHSSLLNSRPMAGHAPKERGGRFGGAWTGPPARAMALGVTSGTSMTLVGTPLGIQKGAGQALTM